MNILLSFRRSGNTWLRYIISHTSDLMCVDGDFKASIQELISGVPKFSVTSENLKKILYKTHGLHQFNVRSEELLESLDKEEAKLIFLVRDCIEVISRHGERSIPEYSRLILQYDAYKGPKFLVKYEDLIRKPERSIKNVLSFLQTFDKTRYQDFCNDIEKHKLTCLDLYTIKQGNTSHTRGDVNKLKYQQDGRSLQQIETMKDSIIEHIGENLFEKYCVDDGNPVRIG